MKLRDLEQHLRRQGCVFFREGGAHTVWLNPSNRKILPTERSPACRVTAKSRKSPYALSANNSESRDRSHLPSMSGDFLALDRDIVEPAPGDLLAVMTAGAYGAVQAGTYNTRALVPEVMVRGDRSAVVRPRVEIA